MEEKLSDSYWESRYQKGETGWDIGDVSTPLLEYFKTIDNKNLRILIPGCGNAYEAAHLHANGFKNVFLLDFAESPLLQFKKNNPSSPEEYLIHQDFFKHKGSYDLIIEQTFFCALDPILRKKYVEQMHQLLSENGKLAGLFFDCQFETEGPPFGGSKSEYESTFHSSFQFEKLEPCRNSISPRSGKELFFIASKL
ncbi:MAG: methyltransferase domain-containing protein [Bacteroidetes bacterium]|nr:methyltransferase domain-containing protein [Bacteroidota bacterium]